ncbi:MAG: glycoside hydrolase family 2 protein [Halobacteriaceae archaeon]
MTETRSLAGRWQFSQAPEDGYDETVCLPGTTDENRVGERNEAREQDRLTRTYPFEGEAWYRRTVTVPERWARKHVELVLERSRVTTVWVNGERVGESRRLSAPQRFDLTDALAPGENTLTVRVDNGAALFDWRGVARSHMVTEETQTNWNGILGAIELRAADPVRVADVQVYPDAARGTARVAVTVANDTDGPVSGDLSLAASSRGAAHDATETTVTVAADPGETTVEVTLDAGDGRWDEFEQTRHEVRVDLTAGDYADAETATFGVRDVETEGTQFRVNGRTTFLRGTVDCCVFPNTGYAPMGESAWRDHLGTMREYGINHVRFHSWCPPEAAFEAADELGMYLQPELPIWNNADAFADSERYEFFRAEAEAILDAYGNHPSFALFALGNELQGARDAMADLVDWCRDHDPRRLYAHGAYNFLGDPHPGDNEDFWITASVSPDLLDGADGKTPVRGSYKDETAEGTPDTADDYRDVLESVDLPVVTHEIGQFQVYPDYDEIRDYGPLFRPENLAVARDHLEAHGMAGRDERFQRASGGLAVDCYRAEVEAALRTPELGGFQLLDLQDFPGQGTALVGILDAHMQSKGLVDPARWRDYCAPTVPLARLETRVWTAEETLTADIDLAHYGAADLTDVTAEWRLTGPDGEVASGTLDAGDVAQGSLAELGTVEADLPGVDAPAALDLSVAVPAADASNRYDVWAYPTDPVTVPDGVTVSESYDEETRELLADGETVVLFPDGDDLRHSVPGSFQPDFWSYTLFKRQAPPGTLGLYCDPDHPALADFPTPGRTDWQWYRIVENGRPVVLDDAPADHEPVVGAVDNIERNQKLGFVFETSAGDGGLLVCAAPLPEVDDPAADQLRRSLLSYAASDDFDPDAVLSGPLRDKLLTR